MSGEYAGTDEVVIFTVIISLIVGVILTYLGIKGRQVWLIVTYAPLIFVSIGYLAWSML